MSIMDTQGTGIQTEEIPDSPMLRGYGLDLYPTTTGEVLGATAEQTFTENPVTYLYRQMQLEPEAVYDPNNVNYNMRSQSMVRDRLRAEGQMLSRDDANKEFGIPGQLTFDTPEIPRMNAQLLNIWKREELRRDEVLRRAQGGVTETVGKYAISFATAAIDPLNIASAFVPVVGEARFGMMVARLGRLGATLTKGAIEGAVGQAFLEPFNIGQARMMQRDYGMMDALLDIGFGGALGGGLHLPGGWLAARAERLAGGKAELPHMGAAPRIAELAGQDAREMALKGSVAAFLEDRPVRVGELLAAAQPDLAERVTSIQRSLDNLTAMRETARTVRPSIVGHFDAAIARLQEELGPAVAANRLSATLQRLEENNVGHRFDQQIRELQEQGDELTRQMVQARTLGRATREAPETLAQAIEKGPARAQAQAAQAAAQAADAADRALLARQQQELAHLEEAPIAGPEDAANRYAMREKLLADIGETKARIADPAATAKPPEPMTLRDALSQLRNGRAGTRMSDAVATEANHQLENPERFDNNERAVVEQVTQTTQKSVSTPTEKQDGADEKTLEESIQALQQMAKAGDVEMPATVKEADALVKQAEGWARGFETAAFCLGRAL